MFHRWLFWRRSDGALRRAADRLFFEHGDQAFFRAHELAWQARGHGRTAQAQFWEAVSGEVCRRLRRRALLEAMLAGSACAHAGQPSMRAIERMGARR